MFFVFQTPASPIRFVAALIAILAVSMARTANVVNAQSSKHDSPRLSPNLISYPTAIGIQQRSGPIVDFQIPTNRTAAPRTPLQDLENIEGIESFPFRGEELKREEEEDSLSSNGREIIRQRYPDGKVQIEREVEQDDEGNYYNHGFWRVKSPDGTIVAQGEFDRGEMSGIWERKHTKDSSPLFQALPFRLFQGPFNSTATFSKGKLDGVWTMNDRYNRKIFEIRYRDGKRDGMATWWYPSMTKMREVLFRDGLIDGPLKEWDQQNKLSRDEEFIAGKKIIQNVSYYRPKQKRAESFFLDAKLETAGEDDWWEARPAKMVAVGERIQHGPVNAWFDNGLPQLKGQYDTGKRVGQFSWWYENGNKRLDGSYIDGAKVGRWTWWHENGMKAIQGNYDAGEPVGLWKRWSPEGQVLDEKDLTADQPEGQGTPDDPAALPEGSVEPATEPSVEGKDDSEIPLLLDELEGIAPVEVDG